jgi:hypothetical protein
MLLAIVQGAWTISVDGRTAEGAELADVRDVTTSPAGDRIFVLEGREGRVRIFDRAGREVGKFGRLGEGPGELSRALKLGWRADTLWVLSTPDRLHFFRQDGTLLRTVSAPAGTLAATVSGGVLVRERIAPLDGRPPPREQGVRDSFVISHRRTSTTRRIATLYESVRPIQVAIRVGGQAGTGFQQQPFRDDPLYLPERDARHVLVVLRQTRSHSPYTFRVLKLRDSGDTVFASSYSYTPRAVDPGVVRDRVDEIERVIREANRQSNRRITWDRSDFERGMYRPAHVPAVESAIIGRDGTIWLKRESAPSGKARYQVLSRTGEAIGVVDLPATERLVEAQADRLWTVATDEDDVSFVKWYRIGARSP